MKTKPSILLLLWLFPVLAATAQTKYSRVKIKIPPGGLVSLQAMRIALDHGELNNQDKSFTTSLNDKEPNDLSKLQKGVVILEIFMQESLTYRKKLYKQ